MRAIERIASAFAELAEGFRDLDREMEHRIAEGATPDEFLTVAEAAKVAKVAHGTIRRWRREGRLPHDGGAPVRVRRADLERALADHGEQDMTPEQMADRAFPVTR